jgi:hypothetical protein
LLLNRVLLLKVHVFLELRSVSLETVLIFKEIGMFHEMESLLCSHKVCVGKSYFAFQTLFVVLQGNVLFLYKLVFVLKVVHPLFLVADLILVVLALLT